MFGFKLVCFVGLEGLIVPIRLEGGIKLVDHRCVRHDRCTHVPFKAGDLRLMGEVRRADVDGGEAAVAPKQPRLCVQASAGCVVRNANLRTSSFQLLESCLLRRTGVGGGEHTNYSPAIGEPTNVRQQLTNPAVANERTKNVDTVGRLKLAFELAQQRRLARCVGQQSRLRKPSLRRRHRGRIARRHRRGQRREHARRRLFAHHLTSAHRGRQNLPKFTNEMVRQFSATLDPARRWERSNSASDHVGHKARVAVGRLGRVNIFQRGRELGAIERFSQGMRDNRVICPGRNLHGESLAHAGELNVA